MVIIYPPIISISLYLCTSVLINASSSGGFVARLRRFFPKGLKNPPTLIIGICNADNYRVLYSLSESYRIKNPDIKRGRIANPPERANSCPIRPNVPFRFSVPLYLVLINVS